MAGPKFFRYMFGKGDTPFWPTLASGQPMPDNCKSRYADDDTTSNVGLGIVHALCNLLTGGVTLGRDGSRLSVCYESASTKRPGQERVASSEFIGPGSAPGDKRAWRGTDATQAPVYLCILEATLMPSISGGAAPLLDEVTARWDIFLEEMMVTIGHEMPFTQQEIVRASRHATCEQAVMGLSDAVYFALKRGGNENLRTYHPKGGDKMPPLSEEDHRRVYGLPQPRSMQALPAGRLTQTLTALYATGGTALLVGPTSTFKTTTAKRAVAAAGTRLVVIDGRPGLEDRDFLGGFIPGGPGEGPRWVDGPVTRAFRTAQETPTVLLIDELLRMETVYLGAFVTLLDPRSPAELAARGIAPVPGYEEEEHYAVDLVQTGQSVACPCSRLTLVATTNVGTSYEQTGRMGDALRGRFELTIEVEEADPDVKRQLYLDAGRALSSCAAPALADLLEAIEAFTAENTMENSGLLQRRGHARLMLNMARQMSRLEATGLKAPEAARRAAQDCVVSYCAVREPSGLLDAAGRQTLTDEIDRLIKVHL